MKKKFFGYIIVLQLTFFSMFSVLSNYNFIAPIISNNEDFRLKNSNWSNATVISDDNTGWNDGTSTNPDITIDQYGNIHVVWYDTTDGAWGTDTEIFYTVYTPSEGWSNATCISSINGWNDDNSEAPSIAVDINGNIHVVWEDDTDGEWGIDQEIFYANYTIANGWSNATAISDIYGWNNLDSHDPRIAVDKNGNVHVVWYDLTDGEWGTDTEILYANYTPSGGWSNATCISDVYGWNNQGSLFPDIEIDIYGTIHVVWHDYTDGEWGTDVEIMYIYNTGSGWSNATVISDDSTNWNDGYSFSPIIASDNNGDLYVVWYDGTDGYWGTDYEIMFTEYHLWEWSKPLVISDNTRWNDGNSEFASMFVDTNGNIHVVWNDATDGEWGTDTEIMYTCHTSSGWSNATCISDLYGWNDDSSFGPKIVGDNTGKIYVVWYDDTDGEWGSDRELMFSSLPAQTSGITLPNIIIIPVSNSDVSNLLFTPLGLALIGGIIAVNIVISIAIAKKIK
ncbi:MAG: hypothetical protein ACTSO9_15110 [Candidatus Helarchaeota archaeon]